MARGSPGVCGWARGATGLLRCSWLLLLLWLILIASHLIEILKINGIFAWLDEASRVMCLGRLTQLLFRGREVLLTLGVAAGS